MPDRGLKHVAVREHLRALATSSPAGTPTPSERALVAQFQVARMTVRQAIDALVADGLLERRPGRGTFVASRPRRTVDPVTGLAEELANRGTAVTTQTLLARTEPAAPGVARGLDVAEGQPVIHLKLLRSGADGPICVEDTYLNPQVVPDLADQPAPDFLYEALAARSVSPETAEDLFTAESVSDDEAELLRISPGAPVLQQLRKAMVADQVVLVSRTVFRSDRHVVRVNLG